MMRSPADLLSAPGFDPVPLAGPALAEPRYGWHLVLDIHDCDPKRIDEPELLRRWVSFLVSAIGMEAHGDPIIETFAHDDPVTAGYSVVQLITTSSITAHFSPHLETAHIDVFSCRTFDPNLAIQVCTTWLGGFRGHASMLARG